MQIHAIVNAETTHTQHVFILFFKQGIENPSHYWKERKPTTKTVVGVEVEECYLNTSIPPRLLAIMT